ncbi:MAG TPA: phosphoglycerate kinase, partial [Actinobacteria bacterium]|nr:phosphoglycerate kinase [Actinomycetota bacterium]
MYFSKKTVQDVDVKDRRVLVRVDLNVPLEDGRVVDDSRIKAALPTINYLRQQQAKVILCSHLGRPKGTPDEAHSLRPVAERLSELLNTDIRFMDKTVNGDVQEITRQLRPGEV